jgi:hypothetical protein
VKPTSSLAEQLAERNAALLNLDLRWARRMVGDHPSEETLLASLHKARVECMGLPDVPRQESCRWLLAHGMKRLTGIKPDPDHLPGGSSGGDV